MEVGDIQDARNRIAGHVLAPALVASPSLSEVAGVPVGLKLEHHQPTCSFKVRGAFNSILQLTEAERARGVITVSTGNHGRALSYAARALGVHATICMSRLVPENKVVQIRRLGADLHIVGGSQDEAQQQVERLVAERKFVMVSPFDDSNVIAGQGTIGLEILDAMPDVAAVLVPVSGGGLVAGIAAAIKGKRPHTKIIGVTMERGAAMKASLDSGRPVQVEELPTLADALGGGIGLDNKLTFALCQALVDDLVLVSESEIAAGIRHAYAKEQEIVEGAGAVGIAALLAGKVADLSGPLAIVLSGRNIDMDLHRDIVNGIAIG